MFASIRHDKFHLSKVLFKDVIQTEKTIKISYQVLGNKWTFLCSSYRILITLEWTDRSLLRKKYLAKFISYSGSVRWGELSWDGDYENSFMGNIMVPLQSKEWACLLLLVIIIIYIMLWVYPWLESSSVKTRNFYIHISRNFILICSLYRFREACVSSDRWAWVEVIKIKVDLWWTRG